MVCLLYYPFSFLICLKCFLLDSWGWGAGWILYGLLASTLIYGSFKRPQVTDVPSGMRTTDQCPHWTWNWGLKSWNDFPRRTKTRIHVPRLPVLCSFLVRPLTEFPRLETLPSWTPEVLVCQAGELPKVRKDLGTYRMLGCWSQVRGRWGSKIITGEKKQWRY